MHPSLNLLLSLFLLVAAPAPEPMVANPPGTLRVKHYYVDYTEILNLAYLEFLYDQKQRLPHAEYQKLLPHSANKQYTFRENAYKPLVMISYEQALAYCAWRSAVVSEAQNRTVTYRLPTAAEWREIAAHQLAANPKKVKRELAASRRKQAADQGAHRLMERREGSTPDGLAAIGELFNLFDNVSEMTLEEGLAMGGNNRDLAPPDSAATKVVAYSDPHPYVGFRCIAELEE